MSVFLPDKEGWSLSQTKGAQLTVACFTTIEEYSAVKNCRREFYASDTAGRKGNALSVVIFSSVATPILGRDAISVVPRFVKKNIVNRPSF